MSYSLFYDIEHNLGIAFITTSIIYLFIITIQKNKAFIPFWFYFLYGIGGMLIFIEMFKKQKHFVYFSELVGFILMFILGIHSFFYYRK
jgi:hypothetical protein